MRVNRAIASGALFENEALVSAFRRGANVHLLGLVSHGGVHSHIDHLQALLELARREGKAEQTWIHAFTDGRDVSPTSAVHDLAELPADRIATVAGRYYAMDRDKRWERTDLALAAITQGTDPEADDPVAAVQASYDAGITDEFIVPIAVRGRPRLEPGDAAIFFNFRPDRGRQLTERLLAGGFDVTTMTRYREDLDCPVAFPEQEVTQVLAEVLAGARRPPAARRRDREVRARDLLLQRRRGAGVAGGDANPRPVPARCAELRPQAGDVRPRGGRALRGRGRRRLPLPGRQLRQPRHGRPHRRDPRGREGGRDGGRLPRHGGGRGRARRRRLPRSRPTTATPSRCSRPTASARSPRTRRTRCR